MSAFAPPAFNSARGAQQESSTARSPARPALRSFAATGDSGESREQIARQRRMRRPCVGRAVPEADLRGSGGTELQDVAGCGATTRWMRCAIDVGAVRAALRSTSSHPDADWFDLERAGARRKLSRRTMSWPGWRPNGSRSCPSSGTAVRAVAIRIRQKPACCRRYPWVKSWNG
jgi:hypothetical protein